MKPLLLVAMLVASIIGQGCCECVPKQLSVSQKETGLLYNFAYIEYNVTFSNQCNCEQREIVLNCRGFKSFTAVDPKLLTKVNDLCSLNSGNPLSAKASLSFTYAWGQRWQLTPFLSLSSC